MESQIEARSLTAPVIITTSREVGVFDLQNSTLYLYFDQKEVEESLQIPEEGMKPSLVLTDIAAAGRSQSWSNFQDSYVIFCRKPADLSSPLVFQARKSRGSQWHQVEGRQDGLFPGCVQIRRPELSYVGQDLRYRSFDLRTFECFFYDFPRKSLLFLSKDHLAKEFRRQEQDYFATHWNEYYLAEPHFIGWRCTEKDLVDGQKFYRFPGGSDSEIISMAGLGASAMLILALVPGPSGSEKVRDLFKVETGWDFTQSFEALQEHRRYQFHPKEVVAVGSLPLGAPNFSYLVFTKNHLLFVLHH